MVEIAFKMDQNRSLVLGKALKGFKKQVFGPVSYCKMGRNDLVKCFDKRTGLKGFFEI
jgi:hypothetical protein